jgi:hypothetical protein
MNPTSMLTDDELAELVQVSAALPDAPPALVRAAVGFWQAREPSLLTQAAEAIVNRIKAVLTFDSWSTTPMALGLRSAPTEGRHLLFSAQGRDIDLRIVSAADSYVLAGQILGPDDVGSIALSVDTGSGLKSESAQTATLDELGGFRLANVRAGTYWMTLKLGSDAVELPPIQVGVRGN